MTRTTARILKAMGLALLTAGLIWGGGQMLEAGRDVLVAERRFPVEYFLGGHLLWILAGAILAVILMIGLPADVERPAGPSLAAAVVPVLMILPIYVWGSPNAPLWLSEIAVHDWLLDSGVQAGASVVAGALLGTALWQRVASSTPNGPRQPETDLAS